MTAEEIQKDKKLTKKEFIFLKNMINKETLVKRKVEEKVLFDISDFAETKEQPINLLIEKLENIRNFRYPEDFDKIVVKHLGEYEGYHLAVVGVKKESEENHKKRLDQETEKQKRK